MPPQNNYASTLVTLQGGLDFVTPKLTVDPGRLIDCYNFEVADRLGYKRIDGLEPFDGRAAPSLVYSNLIFVKVDTLTAVVIGDYLKVGASGEDPFLGVVAKTYSFGSPVTNFIAVVVTNYEAYYALRDSNTLFNSSESQTYVVSDVGGIDLLSASPSYNEISEQYNEYLNIYAALDDSVSPLPSGRYFSLTDAVNVTRYGPATSMKWYKDRLYITQDLDILSFVNANSDLRANDLLEGIDGSKFRVLDFKVFSGSYGDGTADGVMLVHKESGTFPAATLDCDITRSGSSFGSVVIDSEPLLTTENMDSWMGGLWRTKDFDQAEEVYSDQGWEWIDNGYVFQYKDGQSFGSPPVPPAKVGRNITPLAVPVNSSTSALSFGTVVPALSMWSLQGGASTAADAVTATDAKYLRSTTAWSFGEYGTGIVLSGMDLSSIPTDAVLLGVEVTSRCRVNTSLVNFKVSLSAPGSQAKYTGSFGTSFSNEVLGGANDLWGSNSLTMDYVRSSAFKVTLAPTYRDNISARTQDVDWVSIKFYYQITVDQLYFWNGTDDVTATIVNWSLDDPNTQDWDTGTAKGQMHVTSILPVGAATRTYISANDQLRSAAGGTGSLIATVDSNMIYAGVPSFRQMIAEDSRAQPIVANFFGLDDWEAIYTVTGAGRAWTYDGFYFRYIYTGLPLSKDKPRHIEFFQHHLALGYSSGNVSMSVSGQPENFDAVLGAGAFDVGDRITGLLRMNGTTLGVGCESSIIGIQGSTVDDFTTMILSPYEGVIEYTLVNAGGKPVYASYSGISTFEQTAAYGNFLGSRLSASVAPWLLPRLQGRAPILQSISSTQLKTSAAAAISQGVKFAASVRSKNQCRYWFKDGYVLTMTFFGNESVPVFTIHRLYDGKNTSDSNNPIVPFSHHTTVDQLGVERIHVSDFSELGDPIFRRYCYELERGWFFRDNSSDNKITGNFTLTHNYFGSPMEKDILRKVRVLGLSKGRGEYSVACQSDFATAFNQDLTSLEWQPIMLPVSESIGALGPNDYTPATDILDTSARGTNIAIKFQESDVVQPPVVFQNLILQFNEGKGDV